MYPILDSDWFLSVFYLPFPFTTHTQTNHLLLKSPTTRYGTHTGPSFFTLKNPKPQGSRSFFQRFGSGDLIQESAKEFFFCLEAPRRFSWWHDGNLLQWHGDVIWGSKDSVGGSLNFTEDTSSISSFVCLLIVEFNMLCFSFQKGFMI